MKIICKHVYLSLPNLAPLRLGASHSCYVWVGASGRFARVAKSFGHRNSKIMKFKNLSFRNHHGAKKSFHVRKQFR